MKIIVACLLALSIISTAAKAQTLVTADVQTKQLEDFHTYYAKNIKYQALDRENGISGLVIIVFSTDENSNLQYFNVERGISAGCNKHLFEQLKNTLATNKIGKGNWVQALNFLMIQIDDDQRQTPLSPDAKAIASLSAGLGTTLQFTYNPNNIKKPQDPKALACIEIQGYVRRFRNEETTN